MRHFTAVKNIFFECVNNENKIYLKNNRNLNSSVLYDEPWLLSFLEQAVALADDVSVAVPFFS